MNISKIISILDNKKIRYRGNIAYNIGWHSLNFRFDGKMNIPCHSNLSSIEKDILKNMSFLMKQVFSNKIHPLPFYTNKKRIYQFANKLVQPIFPCQQETCNKIENVFESVTFAMTYLNKSSTMLRPHIDSFNCHEKGFNNVFGIYFHMVHPKKRFPYALFYLDILGNPSVITTKGYKNEICLNVILCNITTLLVNVNIYLFPVQ